MSIRVAPELLGRVFFVPKEIVDEHLPYVTGQQLKVLLFVLRHTGEDLEVEDLAGGLSMSAADVSDALQYWYTTGVLVRDDAKPAARPAPAKPAAKQTGPLKDIPDIQPTWETVAARLQEDPALKAMFQEVQARMGRTVGYSTQAKLLMMHDDYGLPPEVILTIVAYAVKKGKGVDYMCKVGKNWAEEGIVTLEDAMEKLQQLHRTDAAWKEFTSQFTVDVPRQTESRLALVRKWRFTFGQSPELMYYAYETTVEAIDKVNFNYMDKMLTRWNEEGLRTPQAVMKAEKGEKAKKAPGAGKNGGANRRKGPDQNHTASYDSEAYREKAQGPIAYKRKNDTEKG